MSHSRQVYLLRLPLSQRSEEHTSELQSRLHLVCRLLLEKKKKLIKVTQADVLATPPVTPTLLKFILASITMLFVSTLPRFIASMTHQFTLYYISHDSIHY